MRYHIFVMCVSYTSRITNGYGKLYVQLRAITGYWFDIGCIYAFYNYCARIVPSGNWLAY